MSPSRFDVAVKNETATPIAVPIIANEITTINIVIILLYLVRPPPCYCYILCFSFLPPLTFYLFVMLSEVQRSRNISFRSFDYAQDDTKLTFISYFTQI